MQASLRICSLMVAASGSAIAFAGEQPADAVASAAVGSVGGALELQQPRRVRGSTSGKAPAASVLRGPVATGATAEVPPLWKGSTVVGALAVVLGLFFLTAWCLKRATPAAQRSLPGDVVEVLGQLKLGESHTLRLLRLGNKLLLVSFNEQRAQTLTEISDPAEVTRVLQRCQGADSAAVTEWLSSLSQGNGGLRGAA